MADPNEFQVQGRSGQTYPYWAHPIGTALKPVPGNYIFAKQDYAGFHPIYVGETSDLSERFDNHHKMRCIARHSATHIMAHTSSADGAVRRAEEADIIAKWNPPCNG